MPSTLRPAGKNDYSALSSLFNSPNYIHRHLDWRDALAWLGCQPFWMMEENGQATATLSCIAEPEEVAWVRVFATTIRSSPDRAWMKLFEPVLEALHSSGNSGAENPAIVSLALREWYEDLLKRRGFVHHQDIVVFIFDQQPPAPPQIDPMIRLREMAAEDLEAVQIIDRTAFEPIWRLSLDDLRFAFNKSSYCTVAEKDGQIIGYTMSSNTSAYAHLARLAIDPRYQGQRMGFALVQDLLDHFINGMDYWGVTLNTQHDNHASLALYHKVGFRETGERFPVFIYPD